MYRIEAQQEYAKALRAGQKEHRECVQKGIDPNPAVLDDILGPDSGDNCVNVGLIEVPMNRIVGTKSAGRVTAFTPHFRPLLEPETEFALKWVNLCIANLGEEGIHDPIECFEYLGNFYIQEGNKRVSVLRHFGAARILANVKRIMPMEDTPRAKAYSEFLEFYRLSGLYEVQYTVPGSYAKLLEKSGFPTQEKWTDEERRRFRASLHYFTDALNAVGKSELAQPEEALLLWLEIYPFSDLKDLSAAELKKTISQLWVNLAAAASEEAVVKTEPPEEKGRIAQIFTGTDHLNVAFVHEGYWRSNEWTRGHEAGRKYLEEVMGKAVNTRVYFGADTAQIAEELIERAVEDGANVVFTTSPPLIVPCMKVSVKYPKVRFLNCSVHQPYATVRNYYSRLYEGKFITGAIAGAMSKNDHIGYIGAFPVYGVPASINAFALGAQMTNPNAKIELKWSSVPGNPAKELMDQGIRVISNRDNPVEKALINEYGTYIADDEGNLTPLGSPTWVWGRFYERMVRRIMDGSWESDKDGQIVNHWWGMSSGVIDVTLSESLPEGVRVLAEVMKGGIRNGTLDPFKRRIVDQQGIVRNDGSKGLEPMELMHMDWLCENVIGGFPKYEDILPDARAMVDLIGVPPSREEVGSL